MEALKISVITPSFNQGEYIRQTIESVVAQGYKNFEHIVMDGGSTDNTVAVLKEYPHLRWFSERDRGQSHALNKGFALASGDIIAWINSDDYYAPDVFKEVAQHLQEYPLYCGSCQVVNEKSEKLHDEPNFDRTYFDICKYWLAYSMPAQPSIFFRRDLLERVKYADQVYLDEGLNYVMDIDLWLRMAAQYPLNRRTTRVLSYYRMTDSNKTSMGTDWFQYAESEMSRIFRRHQARVAATSRAHSFVIPIDNPESHELRRSLDKISQIEIDSEVVLVAYGPNPPLKAVRKIAREFSAAQRNNNKNLFAFACAQTDLSFSSALMLGAKSAAGEILSLIEPGVVPAATWAADIRALFPFDRVGAALPIGHDAALVEHFGRDKFNPNGVALLASPPLPGCTLVRKLAMLEMDTLTPCNYPALVYREILMRAFVRGWVVHYSPQAKLEVPAGTNPQREHAFRNYVNAALLRLLDQQRHGDGFFAPRAATGFWYDFVDKLRASGEKLLARAPADWMLNVFAQNPIEITQKYSEFSPGWYLLAQADASLSANALARFTKIQEEEGLL